MDHADDSLLQDSIFDEFGDLHQQVVQHMDVFWDSIPVETGEHTFHAYLHDSGLGFLTIDSVRHLMTLRKYIHHLVLDSQLFRTSGDPTMILDSAFLHVTLLQYHTWKIPKLPRTLPPIHMKSPIPASAVFSPHYTMVKTPQPSHHSEIPSYPQLTAEQPITNIPCT